MAKQGKMTKAYLDPVKHLRLSFLRKWLTAFNCCLFVQKAPSEIFDWALNVVLVVLLYNT